MNAVRKAFCSRLGISQRAGQNLIKLANKAADSQVKYHNGDGSEANADHHIKAVENAASLRGLSVTWPGLYPVFVKDGQQVHLPD